MGSSGEGDVIRADSPTQSGYLTDAPIDDPDADQFRRRPFANRIADTITLRTDPTSLVVGLYGRWGEGKTTALHFIERRLGESDSVICIRFNPWLYQGESQMLLSFFETLAAAIDRSLKTRKQEMGKWLRTLGAALGSVSVGVGVVNASPGKALAQLGKSLSSVDILDNRKRLEECLSKSGKRIVIMIDDIDRLDDNEIATMFKLVKLAADFQHTAYILAFDQQIVSKALAKRYADSEESGSSFLEKIVQVPIDLPPADVEVLQSMTLGAVSRVISSGGMAMVEADLTRFSSVFQRYLAPHVGTPRMVKRIANAIEFAVPLVAGEVNVVDFVLMEVLRVLFPKVHKKMPAAKDALLGLPFDSPGNNADDLVRGELDPLFEGLSASQVEHVRGSLRELFPRIERLYTNYHYGPESLPGWRASQRICAPDYFDRFFSYGIPVGDLADADLRGFTGRLEVGTREDTARALGTLYTLAAPPLVIQKLRQLETALNAPAARALAVALADTSATLPEPQRDLSSGVSGPFVQAAMLTAQLLRVIPSLERDALVGEIVASTPSLPFASEVLRWARAISGKELPEEARALSSDQLDDLEVALAERVARDAEVAPFLVSMPRHAASLYYDWLRGAGKAPVQQHLVAVCSGRPQNCLALMRAFMPTAWDMRTGAPITSLSVAPFIERQVYDSIAALIDPEVLIDLLADLYPSMRTADLPPDTSGLSEVEQAALRFAQIYRLAQSEGPRSAGADAAPSEKATG